MQDTALGTVQYAGLPTPCLRGARGFREGFDGSVSDDYLIHYSPVILIFFHSPNGNHHKGRKDKMLSVDMNREILLTVGRTMDIFMEETSLNLALPIKEN